MLILCLFVFTLFQQFSFMQQLICQQELELLYHQGKGVWTFYVQIPDTRDLKGKWGDLKVTGTIDGYSIGVMNLAPLKGKDKILSVNAATRCPTGNYNNRSNRA